MTAGDKPHELICQFSQCQCFLYKLQCVDCLHWPVDNAQDPLVTRVCSQHRYTRHKAAVLLLFHKGYKVAPNILRNIKFVPKRCWVKWPISHACAHTLWPFWYPCHTGRKAILLLLLEQPEGYVEVDVTIHVLYSLWIFRWLVFQTGLRSSSEKYFGGLL